MAKKIAVKDAEVLVPETLANLTEAATEAAGAPTQHHVSTEHVEKEETSRTVGQRRINILWEATQAVIALSVTGTGMFTAAQLALRKDEEANAKSMAITAFLLISNTVFLVIGFYFGRTNHQRTGGVGGDAGPTR